MSRLVLLGVVIVMVIIIVESSRHSRGIPPVIVFGGHPSKHVHVQHSSEPQRQWGPFDGLLCITHVQQIQHPNPMGKEGNEEPDVKALRVLEPHDGSHQHADWSSADQDNGRKLLQGAPGHINQQQQLRSNQKNGHTTDRSVGRPVLKQADPQHIIRQRKQQLVNSKRHEDTSISVESHVVHLSLLHEFHMAQVGHFAVVLAVQLVRFGALFFPPGVNRLRGLLLHSLRGTKRHRSGDFTVIGLQGILVHCLRRVHILGPLFLQDLFLSVRTLGMQSACHTIRRDLIAPHKAPSSPTVPQERDAESLLNPLAFKSLSKGPGPVQIT
mmetsp:Transcript_26056/g.57568  ORF Transcript_26056/g.57568 Transcript_26056/m.57568 type:complete len:326 (+) Transcript_26056:1226-2203(+)